MAPGDTLDLQTAADELGVHYQTAYRWVRSGQLPARLVRGRYVVTRHDVDSAARRRDEPTERRAPSDRRLGRSTEAMHRALLDGDEAAARQLARRLVDEGTSVLDLCSEVLVPPLWRIGQAWSDGELTVWQEHRASAIVERILGDVIVNPRGRRRGTVVVAALSGDQHSLPATMAAVVLRAHNWHVQHLGSDLPLDELISFCDLHDVDVAVLSVTSPDVAPIAERAATALEERGVPALVGSQGRTLNELVDAVDAVRG